MNDMPRPDDLFERLDATHRQCLQDGVVIFVALTGGQPGETLGYAEPLTAEQERQIAAHMAVKYGSSLGAVWALTADEVRSLSSLASGGEA